MVSVLKRRSSQLSKREIGLLGTSYRLHLTSNVLVTVILSWPSASSDLISKPPGEARVADMSCVSGPISVRNSTLGRPADTAINGCSLSIGLLYRVVAIPDSLLSLSIEDPSLMESRVGLRRFDEKRLRIRRNPSEEPNVDLAFSILRLERGWSTGRQAQTIERLTSRAPSRTAMPAYSVKWVSMYVCRVLCTRRAKDTAHILRRLSELIQLFQV
jgi:hypothetical protein